MLYLIAGTDTEKKRSAAGRLFETYAKGNVFFVRKGESYSALLDEHIGSTSLFGAPTVVFLDEVLTEKEARAYILPRTPELANSLNVFVFSEEKPVKEIIDAFKKSDAEMISFEKLEKKEVKNDSVNLFALTDAVASRDKKSAWILLLGAFKAGKSPEEIAGLLLWQIKNLILVKDLRASASSLGMKPFVYSKASSAAKKWEIADLERCMGAIIFATHESRRGESDPETALETIILQCV
ncbi:MAG: hypothetical protein MUD00_00810 [Candidatus Pacebacteria bacterium]|jgi:DNA polymerase III delta subunit|nr:hypothetical protein [Candidatus Paceibacterota bacterium]